MKTSRKWRVLNIFATASGCMIDIGGTAYLIKGNVALQWSPAGYTAKIARPTGGIVTLLTPPSIVNCLRAGYVPALHNAL